MSIQEAINSGKKFRRSSRPLGEWQSAYAHPLQWVDRWEILATDWEIQTVEQEVAVHLHKYLTTLLGNVWAEHFTERRREIMVDVAVEQLMGYLPRLAKGEVGHDRT